jgi:hypothetical protein
VDISSLHADDAEQRIFNQPQMIDHTGTKGSLGADGVEQPELAGYNVNESLTGTNWGKLTKMMLSSHCGDRSSCFLNSTDIRSVHQKNIHNKR